ncbi:hypothetical protein L9F63_001633, partial [Diploptera punctata]
LYKFYVVSLQFSQYLKGLMKVLVQQDVTVLPVLPTEIVVDNLVCSTTQQTVAYLNFYKAMTSADVSFKFLCLEDQNREVFYCTITFCYVFIFLILKIFYILPLIHYPVIPHVT